MGRRLHFSPSKLHGRDDETQLLRDAYKRVKETRIPELVFLKGTAGTGKSALASCSLQDVVEDGFLVSGKFNQLQSPQPLSAIVDAFSSLCKTLALRNDDCANIVKRDLNYIMKDDGAFLTKVLPAAKMLLTTKKKKKKTRKEDGEAVGSKWSFERVKVALRDFIRIATNNKSTAIALLIDDLQWADTGSLELLESFFCDPQTEGLLFVGTYRHNKVDHGHPLMIHMRDIQAHSPFRLHEVLVDNLSVDTVNQLIADATKSKPEWTLPLAKVVHQKTNGNAFFTVQFLSMLQDSGRLFFSTTSFCWCWDLDAISGDTSIADNVVDLITNKIENLPKATAAFLKVAACFGSYFDLDVVSKLFLNEGDEPELIERMRVDELDEAVKEVEEQGLVSRREGSSKYKFVHDKVQQAAYSLIPEDTTKQKLHLHIGRLLQRLHNPADPDRTWMFLVFVNQLNRSMDLITEERSRVQLARYNLEVATKVAYRSAFFPACRYLEAGLCLVKGLDGWNRYYNLLLRLYSSLAEVAYCIGDNKRRSESVSMVLKHAKSVEDKYRVFEVRMDSLGSHHDVNRGVDFGLAVLRELGVKLPRKIRKFHLYKVFWQCRKRVKQMNDEDLLALPVLTDKKIMFALRIMSSVSTYAWLAKRQDEYGYLSLLIFLMSMRDGLNVYSSYGFAVYGHAMGSFLNVDEAYRFGLLALEISKRFHSRSNDSRTYITVSCFLLHLRTSLQHCLDWLLKAHQCGMETGQLYHASLASGTYAMVYFYCGLPLQPLIEDASAFSQQVARYNHTTSLHVVFGFHQAALNLVGQCQNPSVLSGEAFDQDEYLVLPIVKENLNQLLTVWVIAQMVSFIYNDMDVSCAMAEKVWKYRQTQIDGTIVHAPSMAMFNHLCALFMWRKKQRRRFKRVARKQLAEVESWVKKKVLNIQHKLLLMQAEDKAVSNKHNRDEVKKLYDDSIAMAARTGFPNDGALAAERAGQYFLQAGETELAMDYLTRSRSLYRSWGALGKVNQMSNTYYSALHDESGCGKSQVSANTLGGGESLQLLEDTSHNLRGQSRFTQRQSFEDTSLNPFVKSKKQGSVYGMGLRLSLPADSITIDQFDISMVG